jgi:ubiquinone/menaquinone biosynthesis C-methylase UbiE
MAQPNDHYQRIYHERPDAYERLVSAEDCEGALFKALEAALPVERAQAVDVGAGTGRVTRLLRGLGVGKVFAFDAAAPMVAHGRGLFLADEGVEWAVGDALQIPRDSESAQVVTAGWVFGHFTSWYAEDWERRVDLAVAEMKRVVTPGGAVVVFETLGTGVDAPAPPHPRLAAYYARLEQVHGFVGQVLRTDYAFGSVEEAAHVCGAFFGDAMAERIVQRGWARVPEFTGMWRLNSHHRSR